MIHPLPGYTSHIVTATKAGSPSIYGFMNKEGFMVSRLKGILRGKDSFL
jgi:hypothetical protein